MNNSLNVLKFFIIVVFISLFFSNVVSANNNQQLRVVIQKGHTDNIISVVFSPNGKYIITRPRSANPIKLWDVASGKEIKTFPLLNSVRFSSCGKYITYDGNNIYDIVTGESVKANKSIKFKKDPYKIELSKNKKIIKVLDKSTGKVVHLLRGHSYPVKITIFSPDGRYLASCSEGWLVILWDIKTGKKIQEFEGEDIINAARFSPNGKYIATGYTDGGIVIWDVSNGDEIEIIETGGVVYSLDFSPDGKYLLSGGNSVAEMWNVATGERVQFFSGAAFEVNNIDFSNTKTHFISTDMINAKVWDLVSGRIINAMDWNVKCAIFSPDGKILATGNGSGSISLWNINSGALIKSFEGHTNIVYSIDFSPDGKYLLSGGWDGKVIQWNISTGKIEKILTMNQDDCTDYISSVSYSKDGKYIGAAAFAPPTYVGGGVKVWNASSGDEYFFPISVENPDGISSSVDDIKFMPDNNNLLTLGLKFKVWDINKKTETESFKLDWDKGFDKLTVSLDGKYIVTYGKNEYLEVWDFSKRTKIRTLICNRDIEDIAFDPEGKYILTTDNNTILMRDFKTGETIVTFIPLAIEYYLIYTPDLYYTCSKASAIMSVHFVKGLDVYTFENFDLIFNRPDIVIDRIGLADKSLVNAYKKAYLKRLKKMGFTEEQISTDMHLPEIDFANKDFPFDTKNKNISFQVHANDSKYNLDRINVYVNDVPIYGVKGISLRSQNLSEITKDFRIELSNGKNKVQVSVHNEKGAESLKETLEIIYNGPITQPDLYVVAIGVSDYIDNDYDLTYASKDADNLATLFENEKGKFGNVNIRRILDNNATKENILKVKETLMQSKVDDEVIIFIAGHGLLDKNLDYYFATTDIDFYNPSLRGLPYEEIEGLLDGIPARKKLLLMDTCHSGEVDKEETEVVASTSTLEGTIKTRSFRGLKLKSKESSLGLQNSFELLKELFADLRRGSGAMVISSASGMEFALESEQWKNGVFTYSVLEGLKTNNADKNNDNEIRISELRDYVIDKVQELTNGRQTPTSRRENLEFDFIVY